MIFGIMKGKRDFSSEGGLFVCTNDEPRLFLDAGNSLVSIITELKVMNIIIIYDLTKNVE